KTFYFSNFEQTRQNTAGVITVSAPNVLAINTQLDAVNYPGPRIQTGSFPSSLDTSNLFLRLDHQWRPSVQSTLRYSFYDVSSENARNVGGLNAISRGAALENRDQTIAASNMWAITPRLLNESRFQFTRSRLDAPVND